MTERAPDLAGPILGWRVWRIAVDGELVSAYTPAGWPARAPIVARCYEHPGQHEAPDEQCVCGVYACDDANAALFYAHRSGSAVVGRTKLWGRVVEHEAGWRAERSYPESVYVPREQFEETADDVAAHLSRRYGVAVHVVEELRSVLAAPPGEPVRPRDIPMPVLPEWVARRVRPQPLAPERDPDPATAPAAVEPAPVSGRDGLLRRLVGRRR
jgi:hypothetical protein